MKSVKPGRGPSMMNGIAAGGAAVFGVIWILAAQSIGAPWFMSAFGAVFILIAIGSAAYSFYSGTAKNRPSVVDIVDESEEPDPLNQVFHNKKYCPQCGKPVLPNARFCSACGEKLSE